jgi:N-acetyl sugar amidotransferase
MDITDPHIEFDEDGVCNHCRRYEEQARQRLQREAEQQVTLQRLVEEIKARGRNKEYDCIIGVSGGIDSTYLAYQVKKLQLRPLAVHMDNGWDSELAVSNIENVLKKLGIDLYTYVLDWQEFKDLQIAFLKASVSDAEIPTDHAIWAALYHAADQRGISYILLGTNHATEGIFPRSWTYGILDWRYIKGVHDRFGKIRLKSYPHISLFKHRFFYPVIKRIQVVSILDYMPYNKREAAEILEQQLDWRPYGGKHYESIYTRFFQGYILPRKFNIDKRRAHLSTLIMSGQITRAEALEQIQHPPYAGYMFEEDMEYVLKKFELTTGQFDKIMALPIKTYQDYPNSSLYSTVLHVLGKRGLGKLARKLRLLPTPTSV